MNGIAIKPSKYFIGLQLLLHMGAIVVAIFLNIFISIKLILICMVFFNFIYMLWRFIFLRSKKSIIKVWYGSKNDWYLLNRTGEKVLAEICRDTIITQFLIILNFKVLNEKRKISVLLFRDVITQDEFRRLRVHLFSMR